MSGPASIGDAFLGKVPPHSAQAEVGVIGSCLLHNHVIDLVVDIVRHDDFYAERNDIIFDAIIELHVNARPVDLVSLGERLKEKGELEHVGGMKYLAAILDHVPTSSNVVTWAKIVAEKSAVRACIGAALDILEKGYGDYGDAQRFLGDAGLAMDEAIDRRERRPVAHINESITQSYDRIAAMRSEGRDVTGVPTGFADLDRILTGLQPRDLIVVAGRPAMGKTAFALGLIMNCLKATELPVVIFSLEMGAGQLNDRLLSSESQVDSSLFRTPSRLTDGELSAIHKSAERIHMMPLYVDDSATLNALELRSRARHVRRRAGGLGLLVVDYLQIMEPMDPKAPHERQVAEDTRLLKALAKELDVPVVCISQLNRAPEGRTDKRPQLADLRASGAIEQDADVIMFLYREAAYDRSSKDMTAEVDVAKNRNGPIGVAKLVFQPQITRFVAKSEHLSDEAPRVTYSRALGLPDPEPETPDEDAPF